MLRKNEAAWVESRRRWQINVQRDGVRKTFSSSVAGKKGKIQAEKKADEWLLKGDPNRCRVNDLLDQWLDRERLTTGTDNYNKYESLTRLYIRPAIGRLYIDKVKNSDLQRIIDTAYSERHLSKKSLQNLRAGLSTFLKFCRRDELTHLTTEFVELPRNAAVHEKAVLQPDEIRKLFSGCELQLYGKVVPDPYVNFYRFAVLTGMRPGELIGLRWSDIRGNVVTIRRAINRHGEETTGKNDNARRSFMLSDQAADVLADQRRQPGCVGSLYVFSDESGEHLTLNVLQKHWKKFKDFNGINPSVSLYGFRHTFVSVNKMMPEGLKKMVVGHSADMDTEGVYGHLMAGDMEKAAGFSTAAFDKIISEK